MTDRQKKPKRNKKPRRGRGEGAIYWREDRERWIAELPLETGKSKYFSGKTYADAQYKLNQAQLEQRQGKLATGAKQTLSTYLTRWLEEVAKPRIRLNTYARYRILIHKHVLPVLGHVQIQKLTPQQLQSFYASKLEEGSKPVGVHMIHTVLHSAFENAVRWGIMPRNVCDLVSPPKRPKHEAQTLTEEQVYTLLEAAKGHRLEALLTVAVTTGMRHGELLGLKWQDIDFEKQALQVRRTVSFLAKHGYKETEPKTEKGRRTIALPDVVVEVLKAHREHQKELKKRAGTRWHELDLVFSNTMDIICTQITSATFLDRCSRMRVFLRCVYMICDTARPRSC
jgi:integrase